VTIRPAVSARRSRSSRSFSAASTTSRSAERQRRSALASSMARPTSLISATGERTATAGSFTPSEAAVVLSEPMAAAMRRPSIRASPIASRPRSIPTPTTPVSERATEGCISSRGIPMATVHPVSGERLNELKTGIPSTVTPS
jgi:hypothetical protein